MNVKKLKEILNNLNDNMEIAFSEYFREYVPMTQEEIEKRIKENIENKSLIPTYLDEDNFCIRRKDFSLNEILNDSDKELVFALNRFDGNLILDEIEGITKIDIQ